MHLERVVVIVHTFVQLIFRDALTRTDKRKMLPVGRR